MGYYKHEQGNVIDGWHLTGHLGAGGNGEVWKARHDEHGLCALKIAHAKHGTERFERFRHEVLIGQRLQGRRVILPLMAARIPDDVGAPAWLATPIAEPIRTALGDAPLLANVVEATAELAGGLAELAAEGIAHRDIKPENLFRHDGSWVVGDLGLADFPEKPELTDTGPLGPIFYIAPEMLMEAKGITDARPADVFSLAKTLFALACGQRFPMPGPLIRTERLTQLASWVSSSRAGLLGHILERATTTDPASRATMAEVHAELRAWLAPPVAPSPAEGLADLRAAFEEQIAPTRAVRTDEERRIGTLTTTVASVAEDVRALFREVQSLWPNRDCNQRPEMLDHFPPGGRADRGPIIYRAGHCFICMVEGRPSHLQLWGGLAAQIYERGEEADLVCGYALLPWGRAPQKWPGPQRVAVPGTAAAEAAMREQIAWLNDNLRKVVETSLEELRRGP
jgi:hypothetical protein